MPDPPFGDPAQSPAGVRWRRPPFGVGVDDYREPDPGSKNSAAPTGAGDGLIGGQGEKATPASSQADEVARRIAAVTPAGTVQSCGSHLDGGFQTTSATFALVRECVITATEAGVALVYASSSVGLASGGAAYEARFALAHISSTGDAATDRWVNVATDSGDGRDRVIVVSRLYRPQSARGRE